MRYPFPIGSRRFGGPDVHASLYLHRIEREDDPFHPLGDLQRHRALAGGGRADNDEQAVQAGLPAR